MSSKPLPVITLRNVTRDDLQTLFDQQLDEDANQMAVVYPRNAVAFQEHWEKALTNPATTSKVIVVDNIVVGRISCYPIDQEHHIGYWIAKEHWGKGIATRALQLLLIEVPIRPLFARAARSNVASIRVLERCGFALTGYQITPADDRFPECEEAMFELR